MVNTNKFAIPLLAEGQSQKDPTANNAFIALEALSQLSVKDKDLATAPGSPAEGDCYIITGTPAGAWATQTNKAAANKDIALRQDGAWLFFTPKIGVIAYVEDEGKLYIFDSSNWVDLATLLILQNLQMLGINTTADTTNRFATKSQAILHDNIGTGGANDSVQVKTNKKAIGDTASHLYQTNYSGRAEAGIIGNDNYHVKVSADGLTWYEAIDIDKSTGNIKTLFETVTVPSAATCDIGATYATIGKVIISGNVTITSLGTGANKLRFIRFSGTPTLTHNATTLILPGSANIVVEAGDTAIASSDASGNWTIRHYQRASGKSLISTTLYSSLSVGSRETDYKLFTEGNVSNCFPNLMSATYSTVKDISADVGATLSGHVVSPDGRYAYTIDTSSDKIKQYIMSTLGDISTATFLAETASTSGQDSGAQDICLNALGTKLYTAGASSDKIHQYSLSEPFNILSYSYDSISLDLTSWGETTVTGICMKPDGTKIYVIGTILKAIGEFTMTTPGDLSTATLTASFSISTWVSSPSGIQITGDGTKIYVTDISPDDVTIFNLSTAWSISSSSYLSEYSEGGVITTRDTQLTSICFDAAMKIAYLGGRTGGKLFQYSLPSVKNIIVGESELFGKKTIYGNLTIVGISTLGTEIKANRVIASSTGAKTQNTPTGQVQFAAAATSLVVTNCLVTTNSFVHVTIATNDATAANPKVEAANGSFTIYLTTAPTGTTKVNYIITN